MAATMTVPLFANGRTVVQCHARNVQVPPLYYCLALASFSKMLVSQDVNFTTHVDALIHVRKQHLEDHTYDNIAKGYESRVLSGHQIRVLMPSPEWPLPP